MKTRAAVALLMMGAQAGCMTGPRRVDYAPREYLSANQPSPVWLTMQDGGQIVVVGARVLSDTLFGWDESGTKDLTIALSDIREVRARRLSIVRSVIVPGTLILGAVLAATFVKGSSELAAPPQTDTLDLEGRWEGR